MIPEQSPSTSINFVQALLDNVGDVIYWISPAGEIVYVNQTACRLLGYAKEELVGRMAWDLDADLSEKLWHAAYEKLQVEGEWRKLAEAWRKDGHALRLEVCGTLEQVDGKPMVFCIARDVTARWNAEYSLVSSREFLEKAIDTLPMHVAILDAGGHIAAVNQAWRDFGTENGISQAFEWIGVNYLDVCQTTPHEQELTQKDLLQALRDLLAGRLDEYNLEYPCHSPEKKRWFHVRFRRFVHDDRVWVLAAHNNITYRRRIEESLRDQKRLQETLLNTIPDIAWFKDRECRYILINNAYARSLGKSPEEVIGLTDFELFPDELAQMYHRADQQVIEKGEALHVVEPYVDCGGGHWLDTTKMPCFDEAHKVVGSVGIAHDITRRKEIEFRAERDLQLFKGLYDLAVAMSADEGPDANLRLILERTCAMVKCDLGSLALALPEDNALEVRYTQGYRTRHFDHLRLPMDTGIGGAVLREGKGRIVLDYLTDTSFTHIIDPRAQEEGFVSGIIVPVMRDKTPLGVMYFWNRHRTEFNEQELEVVTLIASLVGIEIARQRVDEARLKALESLNHVVVALEQINEGIVITDAQGVIRYANPAIARMTGYVSSELIGQTPRLFQGGKQDASFYAKLWQTISQGQIWQGHFTNKRKDGTLYEEEATISPVRNQAGNIVNYVSVKRDVTQELERDRQLRQSQKLEAVGQLAAGIAHEINTPTQYVGDNTCFLRDGFNSLISLIERYSMLTEMVREHPPAATAVKDIDWIMKELDVKFLIEEIPKAIEQSLEGIKRVTHIVRAMKEFSHPDSGDRKPIDLNHAIDSTLVVCRNRWKYVADLEMHMDHEIPPVPLYIGEFNQVILNLVTNAADAISDVVATRMGTKGKITVTTRLDGNFAEVRITDTGTGIKPEHQTRIFNPFFTTKDVGKGTGQGLAMAHHVITEKHRGSIRFDTEVGKGTTFILRLPLEVPTVAGGSASSAQAA